MNQNVQSLSYTTAAEIGACPTFNGFQVTDGYAIIMALFIVAAAFVIGILSYSAGSGDAAEKELKREREARPQKDADALAAGRREFFVSISQDASFTPEVIAERMKAWDAEKFSV